MTKEAYRIVFEDRVLDPVHGFIDLTRVEYRIFSLPIFKRLQAIKQLSMTNWVFPGAEHTRLIHSLGVMYIADQMLCHLQGYDFNDGDRQLIRLAGLLHDIGHYPLSHVTESVYNDSLEKYDNSLKAHNLHVQNQISDLAQVKIPEYMKSRYSSRMHHESIGAEVIRSDEEIQKIIAEECGFIDINDICDIIVGSVDRNPLLSVFVQLIHSELDADGIDYIMRDSSFSGTSYGGFELGMLLRNLTVGMYHDTPVIGVMPKGVPVVDQYLINKYFSYTQVIFNKHVAILDLMVEKITREMICASSSSDYPTEKMLRKWITGHNIADEYLLFTDVFFWSQVSNKNAGTYFDNEYVQVLLDHLIHYREPECAEELVIASDSRENALNQIKESPFYQEMTDSMDNEKDLYLMHSREFTKEIPIEKYERMLRERWGKEHDNDHLLLESCTKRMQEGVVVIDSNLGHTEPHLLVDDPRSVMSSLWKNRTFILRRYRIE